MTAQKLCRTKSIDDKIIKINITYKPKRNSENRAKMQRYLSKSEKNLEKVCGLRSTRYPVQATLHTSMLINSVDRRDQRRKSLSFAHSSLRSNEPTDSIGEPRWPATKLLTPPGDACRCPNKYER